MLPDQLTSSSITNVLTIESDLNSFNLSETAPLVVVQPDLSFLDGSLNSQGSHWFKHSDDGKEFHYINLDGTRYYEYSDQSSVFCDPRRDGGLVRYRSPSEEIEKEVKGKGSILLVIKRSNDGLILHIYSPLPMGKLQSDIYRKYVSEANRNL